MAYTPVATDATQPTDDQFASTAAAEFRAVKAYLNGVVAAGLPAQPPGGGALVSDGTTISWQSTPNLFNYLNLS